MNSTDFSQLTLFRMQKKQIKYSIRFPDMKASGRFRELNAGQSVGVHRRTRGDRVAPASH